jgi:hypothetical protein
MLVHQLSDFMVFAAAELALAASLAALLAAALAAQQSRRPARQPVRVRASKPKKTTQS